MKEGLTENTFAKLVQQQFEVFPTGGEKVALTLVEVKPHQTQKTEGFSLLFRGPKDRVFRHDTHRITHTGLGEFQLFVGPVMTGKNDGVYYEAVFNRLKDVKQ